MGALAAFSDGPDDKRLTAAHVTCSEDTGDARSVVGFVGRHVSLLVEADAELLEEPFVDRAGETHGQKHEIGLEFERATGHIGHLPPAIDLLPFDARPTKGLNPSIRALERCGRDRPQTFATLVVGR